MAENPIDVIRNTELEAEKILNDAAMESEHIKQETKLETARISKEAEAAAKAAAERAITAAREKSRLTLRNAEAALEAELLDLRNQAGERRNKAVSAVIASLV